MKIESKTKSGVIPERYVDIKTVSKYTSLPVKSLYELASLGKIPSIKLGRRVLFDLVDIDKLMSSLKRINNQVDKTVNKIVGDLHSNGI